ELLDAAAAGRGGAGLDPARPGEGRPERVAAHEVRRFGLRPAVFLTSRGPTGILPVATGSVRRFGLRPAVFLTSRGPTGILPVASGSVGGRSRPRAGRPAPTEAP